jgi:hypothetical protein
MTGAGLLRNDTLRSVCRGYDLKAELGGLAAESAFCPLSSVYVMLLKHCLIVRLMGLRRWKIILASLCAVAVIA